MPEYDDFAFSESENEKSYNETIDEIRNLENLLADHGIISRANVVLQHHMCVRDAKRYGGEKCICSDTETAKAILQDTPITDTEYNEQITEWKTQLAILWDTETELAGTFKDYFID